MKTGFLRRRAFGAAVFLCALTIGVLFAGLGLRSEIDALRSSPSDNVEWSVSQLDVDVLGLKVAIRDVRLDQGALSDVRKRYDILYSRVRTIGSGSGFAQLRSVPSFRLGLEKLETFLTETTPLIDLPDPQLASQIDDIDARLSELRGDVRRLSTQGVQVFAKALFGQREKFVDALMLSIMVGLGLILLLGISLVILDRHRRLAQQRAGESERDRKRLIATNSAALEAIIVADHLGKIIDWNPGAEQIFGRSAIDVIGADMSELIIPEQFREAHRAGMARYLETGEKRVIDAGRVVLSALRIDGTEFPAELAIATTESDGAPVFISYMRDISKRVATQQELTEARDDAMAADRAKSQFLAVMSHEMRTPLNGVLGVMDLMAQTDLTPEQRAHVETATFSGEVLLRHVNDVLDITRIEAGRMDFEASPVDLTGIVAEVLEIGGPLADVNRNTIHVRTDPELDQVLSDPHRLRQVLLNLVGNAAKFTEDGIITVDIAVLDRATAEIEVEVSVHNTGPSIASQDRERIFEDFVTLDAAYNRSNSGSGLGLAISKRIIEGMSGSIGLSDDVHDGNRFWFRLRLPLADKMAQATPVRDLVTEPVSPARSCRILLVEDNALNRDIVRTMLKQVGHDVVEATNGLEGAELAERGHYDLILMDISMPEVNGIEATEWIRSGDGPCRSVPIIGLTAHALPNELEEFAKAGMQLCLTKPIRREVLLRTIAEVTSEHSIATPAEIPPVEAIPLIDEEVFSDLVIALSPTELSSTLGQAVYELEHGLIEVRRLHQSEDNDALQKRIHHLAGSCAIIGASGLQSHFAAMEYALKRNEGDRIIQLLAEVDPMVRDTTRTLNEFVDQ